jgi:2',3'-cyclic-nucleotide 2'-phosphodiesterase (5'-nucleotidase family)
LAGTGGGRPSAVVDVRTALTPVTDALPADPDMSGLLAPYEAALKSTGLDSVLAYAPSALSRTAPRGGDSAVGNLVAHAMLRASGADVAVINTTGIRADIAEGPVTGVEVFSLVPFDDALVVRRVTAGDLTGALDRVARASCTRRQSQIQLEGATVSLQCADGGPRATFLAGGRSLEPGAVLHLGTTSFLTETGAWFDIGSREERAKSPIPLYDVMAGFVRQLPACAGGRLPCLDSAAGARVDGRIEWR